MAKNSSVTSKAFEKVFKALIKAYSGRRRPTDETVIDRVALAVFSEGIGERAAARHLGRFRELFVDWNEIRVARYRDLASSSPDAPEKRLKRLQSLLQALYESLGCLEDQPLLEMKPSEARELLLKLEGITKEEVEAILMMALGVHTLPASPELARVTRRMGLCPRKATRKRAQKECIKGLATDDLRDFYGLAVEHAATVCHEQVPDCKKCKLTRICKSKGKW